MKKHLTISILIKYKGWSIRRRRMIGNNMLLDYSGSNFGYYICTVPNKL